MTWDCAVLGAGPAGLSAAFYMARAGHPTVVVDPGAPGGKCRRLGLITNHPGFPGGVDGAELAARFARQARRHGAALRRGSALAVSAGPAGLRVHLDGGALEARSVVVATGTDFLPLGLAEEERFRGRGVENAAFEKAPAWRGRRVGVVGGGETAAHQALRLARAGARVRLWLRGPELKAVAPLKAAALRHPRLEVCPRTRVTALLGDTRLRAVELSGRVARREALDALFVLVGQRPRLPSLPRRADGLFLAGDAAGLPRQTAVAAASGLAQAMAAAAFLEEQ